MSADKPEGASGPETMKPGLDGFPLEASSPHYPWHCLINELFDEVPKPFRASAIKPADFPAGHRILNAVPTHQVVAVEAIMLRRLASDQELERVGSRSVQACECRDLLRKLTSLLLRRKLPITASEGAKLITLAATGSEMRTFDDDLAVLLKIAERLQSQGAMSPELRRALEALRSSFDSGEVWEDAGRRRVRAGIDKLLGNLLLVTAAAAAIDTSPRKSDQAEGRLSAGSAAGLAELLGWDGFPIRANDPLVSHHRQLDEYLKQSAPTVFDLWRINPRKHAAGRDLLAQSPENVARTIAAIVDRLVFWRLVEEKREAETAPNRNELNAGQLMDLVLANLRGRLPKDAGDDDGILKCPFALRPLLDELLKTNPPLSSADLEALVELAMDHGSEALLGLISRESVVRAVEHLATRSNLSPSLRQRLNAWRWKIQSLPKLGAENRKLLGRISAVIGTDGSPGVEPGEAWSDAALADLETMPAKECGLWVALLRHCGKAESSKPSGKWSKVAAGVVEEIGRAQFKTRILRWFELVAHPRPVHQEVHPNAQRPDPDLLLCEHNTTILRGLAWCCAGWNDAEVSSALSTLAEVCFKKVRWLGPRCPRVGNACLYSLSTTSSEAAAAQLSRLDSTVKQPTARKRIDKSLDAAASLTGQTREDLEEKSVPTFDLDLDGKVTRTLGDFTAEICVINSRDIKIIWSKRDGKQLKSAPAEVKRDHGGDFKKLQKFAKDMEKMLAAQRIRLERLLMTERAWEFEAWRRRYLDHPLLSGITQRLIWHFQLVGRTALGAWLDGKLVDVQGKPLDWLAPETRVRLWHPIGFPVETVSAWREWLQTHEVCQPFKQAHREIYMLTDAELRTANYSNRFAAHILGQHQFAALCTQRGWKYSFMGGFDVQATPTLELPAWDMAAEFWVEPAGELAASGVSLYLVTDQVRFVRDDEPLPLTEVPAPVFSEVMRDVDLFVGVGSVGSDPAWQDHGEIEGAGDYWRGYSFGDLNAMAKTRKEVLEHLIPRLKIAGQCSFEEKFLVVRGHLRTYKIHLGSGNIQMEPNQQYLCIVADRGGAAKGGDKFFLPFEGDRTLSIILSKAFLLAEDEKIKDPSIVSQIKLR